MTDGVVTLSETAQATLRRVVEMLGDGFTGTLVLNCASGGVTKLSVTEDFNPRKLDAGLGKTLG